MRHALAVEGTPNEWLTTVANDGGSPKRKHVRSADSALLWARSFGQCGFPGCNIECVQEGTEGPPPAIIGEIAHIEASSDTGPRPNPRLSERERVSYRNLILLCPNHHRMVDRLPDVYPAERLGEWKADMEKRYATALARETRRVTFLELNMVTRNLVNRGGPSSTSISVVPLREKMNRNGLTEATEHLLNIGLLKVKQVQGFVQEMSGLDGTFVANLTSGFVEEYQRLRSEGLDGDSLFNEMQLFSAQWRTDLLHQGAGLAVLVYLFERCEVFEQ